MTTYETYRLCFHKHLLKIESKLVSGRSPRTKCSWKSQYQVMKMCVTICKFSLSSKKFLSPIAAPEDMGKMIH